MTYIPAHRRCTRKRHHRFEGTDEFYMDLFQVFRCTFCGKREE